MLHPSPTVLAIFTSLATGLGLGPILKEYLFKKKPSPFENENIIKRLWEGKDNDLYLAAAYKDFTGKIAPDLAIIRYLLKNNGQYTNLVRYAQGGHYCVKTENGFKIKYPRRFKVLRAFFLIYAFSGYAFMFTSGVVSFFLGGIKDLNYLFVVLGSAFIVTIIGVFFLHIASDELGKTKAAKMLCGK